MRDIKVRDEEPPSTGGHPEQNTDRFIDGFDNLHLADKKLHFFKKVASLFGIAPGLRGGNSLEKEVAELIEEHDPDGVQVGSEEREMLHNVLSLRDVKVHDVMVPRTDIVAVEKNIRIDELQKAVIEKEHTRMPVYAGSLDNVIGFLHIKDLIAILGTRKKFDMDEVLREILFVPPSMKILDLLVKMRSKRVHMALVLDEYGGTDGLVTMEDLMEEIVGEIEDEHDEIDKHEIKKIDDHTIEVSARITIEELEERLDKKLKSADDPNDYDTLGGLVFFMLGKVPEQGEVVNHPCGLQFKIIEADPRRINRLTVSW